MTVKTTQHDRSHRHHVHLSDSQLTQVFEWIDYGLSDEEIAAAIDVPAHTVYDRRRKLSINVDDDGMDGASAVSDSRRGRLQKATDTFLARLQEHHQDKEVHAYAST
jgi:transposase